MMSVQPISYETYKYIHPPEYEHSSFDVLESRYKTAADLGEKFTVYTHGVGYRVYASANDFIRHLGTMSENERAFHEVILSVPQKLKFDIDSPLDKLAGFDALSIIAVNDTLPDCGEQVDMSFNRDIVDPEIAAFLDTFSNIDLPESAENNKTAEEGQSLQHEETSKYKHIFETILSAIRDAFFITYGLDLTERDEIICESKDLTTDVVTKFSNHIIIDNFYVQDHEQAREFTRRVAALLPDKYRVFLDLSVNKRIQNFRMVNCHKTDESRTKRIITGHEISRAIITNTTNCVRLPDIAVRELPIRQRTDLHPDDIKAILELCYQDQSTHAHKHKFVRNGVFIFARQRPSACEFCNKTHDKDNTLVVTTQIVDGVITVFKQCRRYLDEKGKDGNHFARIGELQSCRPPIEANTEAEQKMQETKIGNWTDKMVLRTVADLANGELYSTRLLFDDLPTKLKNVYTDSSLAPFELTNTLVVHAAMKMGKTKALKAYLTRYFNSTMRPPIIRFVSFRQTFSGNIKEKFTDFTLYNEVKGPLNADKLIVQVESLHRLDVQGGMEPPDLLILDECESIFEQFDSGLLRGNFNDCFAKFQYLMRYSKHVICMDANVSDRTYRILMQMRPIFAETVASGDQIVYHCNRYKNARDDKYFVCGNKIKWLGLLYSSIEADERIAVPTSSLNEAKVLAANLEKKYRGKNIKLYSSETAQSEKREHFADVNTHWSQYDVLIYTPTVSAGVSFEQKHFNKIFGYFTDLSCPVETCQQMIGRIRDVADHHFYICIAATGNNLPTDVESLKQMLYTKRENLMRQFDDTGLRFEYSLNGELIYHSGDYFQMWLENMRIRNLSRNSFIRRFIHIISTTGASVDFLSDEVFEQGTGLSMMVDGELNDALVEIQKAHAAARVEIRSDVCQKIANAPDLDDAALEEIHTLIIAQKDITEEQKYAFEKHRLRVDYRYEGAIDEKFVDKYRDVKVRRMFKNITRICAHDTIEEAWKQIQAEECANHKYLMSMGESSQYQDLNRKYVFDQHRYALSLLRLCGWKNINDPQFVHQVRLAQNLRENEKLYWDNIRSACVEFGIKTPKIQAVHLQRTNERAFIDSLLKPVNKILVVMYGVCIATRKKDPQMFFLVHNTMFTMDPKTSHNKNIPLIIPIGKTAPVQQDVEAHFR